MDRLQEELKSVDVGPNNDKFTPFWHNKNFFKKWALATLFIET